MTPTTLEHLITLTHKLPESRNAVAGKVARAALISGQAEAIEQGYEGDRLLLHVLYTITMRYWRSVSKSDDALRTMWMRADIELKHYAREEADAE